MHDTLDWAECDQEIAEFEKNVILKHVFDTELKEKPYPLKFNFEKILTP